MDPINVRFVHGTHERFLRHHEAMLDREIKDAADFPQKHVREQPRGFKHRTGNLTQKTKGRLIRVGKRKRLLRVSNTARYAAAQDGGSGLHGPRRRKYIIRPRRKQFLRFVARDGSVVFTRKVMHPGVKPTRFLFRATNATFRVLGPNIEDGMRRVASRFGKI